MIVMFHRELSFQLQVAISSHDPAVKIVFLMNVYETKRCQLSMSINLKASST